MSLYSKLAWIVDRARDAGLCLVGFEVGPKALVALRAELQHLCRHDADRIADLIRARFRGVEIRACWSMRPELAVPVFAGPEGEYWGEVVARSQ